MYDVPSQFLSGPFARADALAAGVPARVLEGARFVRDHTGVYHYRAHEMTFADRLRAARLALPPDARTTGITRLQELGLDHGPRWPLHFVVQGDLHLALEGGAPAPRAAAAGLVVAALGVLEQVGVGEFAAQVDAAVDALTRRRDEHGGAEDQARAIAQRVGRTLPLVYGAGPIGAVAARHWKSRLNQDAKAPAFAHHVPALLHDELSGWGQHGDVTRQVFRLVALRHEHEHPQIARRFELVADAVDEVVDDIDVVWAAGEGALAQLLDLILFGDFVTLHAAAQEGLDPGPVPILDEIKAALREEV